MSDTAASLETNNSTATPHFSRVLTLWDLIFYGIILISPIAAVPLFGVVQVQSHGYIVDTLLLGMFAMMVTAFSYGRMSSLYPSAGSAYTFVGHGLNLHVGFLVGWAMFLEYLLQLLINAVWVADTIHGWVHWIPSYALMFLFVAVVTFMNLRGIRTSALANKVLLASMSVIIVAFIILAIRYLFHMNGWRGLVSSIPIYDPKTFDFRAIRTAVPLAALTFIGFDGVTTLAEDAKNPRRNVLLATVLVCLFTGVFCGFQVYLGQLVLPSTHFENVDGAFMDVCLLVGGRVLFLGMTAVTVVAAAGCGLTGGLAAARLLFGMGRESMLPQRIFTHLDSKHNAPSYNIWIIGIVSLIGAMAISRDGHGYENGAELLNLCAFICFIGVNFATFWQFGVKRISGNKTNLLGDIILPLAGLAFCAWLSVSLNRIATILGAIWIIAGIVYLAWKTRWFRDKPAVLDFGDS
jgi:putrescine importer